MLLIEFSSAPRKLSCDLHDINCVSLSEICISDNFWFEELLSIIKFSNPDIFSVKESIIPQMKIYFTCLDLSIFTKISFI